MTGSQKISSGQALSLLPEGEIRAGIGKIPDGSAMGYTESPRGETFYWINPELGSVALAVVKKAKCTVLVAR